MAGTGVKVRVDAHPEADPQEMADLSWSLTIYARGIYDLAEAVGLELIHAGWQYYGRYKPLKPTLFVDLVFADSRRDSVSKQPAIWRAIPNWDQEKRRFDPQIGPLQPGQFPPGEHNHLPKDVPADSFEMGMRQILTGVIAEVQWGFWDHCRVQEMTERQTLDKVQAFDSVGAQLFSTRRWHGIRSTG